MAFPCTLLKKYFSKILCKKSVSDRGFYPGRNRGKDKFLILKMQLNFTPPII